MGSDSVPSVGIPKKYRIWGDGSAAPSPPPQALGSLYLVGAKAGGNGQILTLRARLNSARPCVTRPPGSPDGSSPGAKFGRARSWLPPRQHAIAKATLQPPPLRLHACTRSCDRQGCGWVVSPSPVPPRGSFPLLGAEPTAPAPDPIGCWWPGRWPSTCRPRLPGVPRHRGVLGATTPGTDPPLLPPTPNSQEQWGAGEPRIGAKIKYPWVLAPTLRGWAGVAQAAPRGAGGTGGCSAPPEPAQVLWDCEQRGG